MYTHITCPFINKNKNTTVHVSNHIIDIVNLFAETESISELYVDDFRDGSFVT